MHDFYIIEKESINSIVDKLYKTLSINVIDKIKLRHYLNELLLGRNKEIKRIGLSHDIFRLMDSDDIDTFYDDNFKELRKNFNFYGITIISYQSLPVIIKHFENISEEEKQRLSNHSIREKDYKDSVKELLVALKKAYKDKNNVIHVGI